ncbi:hypothetical protein ACET3Z_030523 [Daucus carota]
MTEIQDDDDCVRISLKTQKLTVGDKSLDIVNWRTHLKCPAEVKLSFEARDLTTRLLCDVNHRLGTRGVYEIKLASPLQTSGKAATWFCNNSDIF